MEPVLWLVLLSFTCIITETAAVPIEETKYSRDTLGHTMKNISSANPSDESAGPDLSSDPFAAKQHGEHSESDKNIAHSSEKLLKTTYHQTHPQHSSTTSSSDTATVNYEEKFSETTEYSIPLFVEKTTNPHDSNSYIEPLAETFEIKHGQPIGTSVPYPSGEKTIIFVTNSTCSADGEKPYQSEVLLEDNHKQNKENMMSPEESERDSPDCNFFNDSCAWQLNGDIYKHYDWQFGRPETAFFIGGPETDGAIETDATTSGYSFVDGSVFSDLNLPDFYLTAWMSSPVLRQPKAGGFCLRFRYNTEGVSIQSLRVLRVDHVPTLYRNVTPSYREGRENGTNIEGASARMLRDKKFSIDNVGSEYIIKMINATEILWESSDNTEGQWHSGHVTYNSGYEHRLVFEATPHLSPQMGRGYAAVDDVTVEEFACDNDCNFEDNFCLWTNNPNDNFDWQLARGSNSKFTGPIRDHGSAASYSRIGGYAGTNSSFPRRPGDEAWLDSILLPSNGPLCLSFYASMFGAGVGSLSLQQIVDDGETRTLWRVDGGSGSQLSWNVAQVTLAATKPFRARFVATVGDPGLSDIAIDSVRLESGSCSTIPSVARVEEISCSFIDDLCDWEIESATKRLWRRVPGGHTRLSTSYLQSVDHHISFSVDNYKHLEGSRDTIISPVIGKRGVLCLEFWLQMASTVASTPKIGSLSVLLSNIESNSSETIWRIDNHFSESWKHAQVSFSVEEPARIAVQGIRGSGNSGVIAVDDLIIYEGDCAIQPAKAAVTPHDCSFEKDTCRWTIESDSSKKWQLATKRNRVSQLKDHTHNTESGYLFFDPLNQRVTARLVSQELAESADTPRCLGMWYKTVGGVQEDATLSLRIRKSSSVNSSDVIWQVTQGATGAPDNDSKWRYGQVPLPPVPEPFQILVEALGMQAGFAVDDIRLQQTDTLCAIRPQSAAPSAALR